MAGKRYGIPSRQLVGRHHMATDWGLVMLDWMEVEALPCTPPTIPEFRARFPEFVNVSDAQIQIAIDDASCWADSTWIENGCPNCTTAIAFLAAHFVAMGLYAADMLPDTLPPETPGGPTIIAGGQVTSLHFESMSVGFAAPQAVGVSGGAASSGIGDSFAISATPYGQRYLELLKVNKPAVLVV
jgi:hypothetical protein